MGTSESCLNRASSWDAGESSHELLGCVLLTEFCPHVGRSGIGASVSASVTLTCVVYRVKSVKLVLTRTICDVVHRASMGCMLGR